MQLIQLLLPLYDNQGQAFDGAMYQQVRDELIAGFGGVTAYTRAPASGMWQQGEGAVRDDLIIYEVMTEALDQAWWRNYRVSLEQRFLQESLVIRAHEIRML